MTSASQAAALPAMDQHIGFRPQQPDDEPFLCRLYTSTRTEEMALTGWPEEQKEAFLRQQFQFQTVHYRRYYNTASFDIILYDQRPVGRIYVHRSSNDIRLMDVALMPEYRGAGIGSWILRNLLAEAARSQTPVTLHVEPYNPAVRLYRRLGFRVVEQQGMNLFMECRTEHTADRSVEDNGVNRE